MPAPRKPSNVLEFRGSFKKNPSRRRKVIKASDEPIGSPPGYLTQEQVDVWHEILRIAPPGIIKATDRMPLEVLTCLMCEFRQGPTLFTASRIAQLMALFGRFGLTPADREKMSMQQDEPVKQDQYAEFR